MGVLKFRGKVHVFKDKGPHITIFLNGHISRFPGSMPCICIDPDHHGIFTAVFLLQGGCIFEGMSRYDPVVMICGGDHDGDGKVPLKSPPAGGGPPAT